jgi:SLOG in TRPM
LIKSKDLFIFSFKGAWIITGGMNRGIMKLVGEIIQINPDRSRPIHLIVN